jgi:hypothetical protein
MEIRWDSGRTSSLEASEGRHLDYGYALTSHSSQGQTAGRVLVHVETERAGEKLVNQRLAYVAVSRGQYDARIYTNDKAKLARVLDRDVSHRSALERTPGQALRQSESREISRSESVGHSMAVGRSSHGAQRRQGYPSAAPPSLTPPPRRASDTLLSPAILQAPSQVLSNRCQTVGSSAASGTGRAVPRLTPARRRGCENADCSPPAVDNK